MSIEDVPSELKKNSDFAQCTQKKRIKIKKGKNDVSEKKSSKTLMAPF